MSGVRVLVGLLLVLGLGCGSGNDERRPQPVAKDPDAPPCTASPEQRKRCQSMRMNAAQLYLRGKNERLDDRWMGYCLANQWPRSVTDCGITARTPAAFERCIAAANTAPFRQASKGIPEAWWTKPNMCPPGVEIDGAPPPKGSHVVCYATYVTKGPMLRTDWHDGSWSKKSEGRFEHGDKLGTWTFWSESGCLESVVEFVDGKQHGQSITYKFGEVISIAEYRRGERIDPAP